MFLATCFSLVPTFAHDTLSTALVIVVALLVATTITLIDRLFFQADWFVQAESQKSEESASRQLRRWLIMGVRMGLSVSVAIVVAGFIDLFIFQSDIDQQIERMVRRENAAEFAKIDQRRKELDDELDSSKSNLARDEEALSAGRRKETSVRDSKDGPSEFDKEIAQAEHDLPLKLTEERNVRAEIARHEAEKRSAPLQLGAGIPSEQYLQAVEQLRLSNAHLTRVLAERKAIEAKIKDLTTSKRVAHEGDLNFFHKAVEQSRAERDNKLAQYTEELRIRDAKLAEFTAFVMAQPTFVHIQKGLFAQVMAYSELKQQWPIWWESVATTLFIIFIEAAPILAKMFFSPSSVYAVALARRISEAIAKSAEGRLTDQRRVAELELEVQDLIEEREDRARQAEIMGASHEDALKKVKRELASDN
jgi:hypothetical protein